MPLLGKEPITPIQSYGSVDQHRQESNNLFQNFWTAKEFAVPGEGMQNNAGTGWVGGVAQVSEIGNYPLTQPWEQTSLLESLLKQKLIKEKIPLPEPELRSGEVPGIQAMFYPKELLIDYGAWLTQVYKDNKGIAALTDLGNNTYQAKHYYPPTNLSQEKLGSTLAGLKQKGLIKS